MTTNDRDIVSELKAALADQIGQQRFDLWFGSGVTFELEQHTVRISAPDQFILERIRNCFQKDLQQVCQRRFGWEATLEFRVNRQVAPGSQVVAVAPQAARRSAVPTPQLERQAAAGRKLASLADFVVGDSNRLAYTAACGIADRPGNMSPLYLYGPTGAGKTHLLEAILEATRGQVARRRSVLLSAEQFTTYFVHAIREQGLPSFRRKYRDVELLLIDDLQFFANKRATIVELQHTMDTLERERRQIVFAADRSPAELSGFGRELTARIAGGLVCRMEPADQATRLGILQNMALRRKLNIPDGTLQMVADRLDGDARQLMGALNRLQATSEALGQPISEELVTLALEDVFHASQRFVRLPDIERAVCEVFGIEAQQLHSTRKGKSISQPRMLAMWLARKYTRAPYSEIGYFFGRRSHSTVISAQHKVSHWMRKKQLIQLRDTSCSIADAIRRVELRMKAG